MLPLLVLLVISAGRASAQDGVADTSSPRATLRSFIDACNEIHAAVERQGYLDRSEGLEHGVVRRILDCIDARELPAFAREERAGEVAACLKEIIDRVDLPAWDKIPGTEDIEEGGEHEGISRWRIPGTRITIARVEEGRQKHEYLFSPGTVYRAVDYYHSVESKPYRTSGPEVSPNLYRWYMSSPGHPAVAAIVEHLPNRLRYGRSFGLTNWKWPGLFIASAIALAIMALAYRLQVVSSNHTRGKRLLLYMLTIVFPVGAMIVPMWMTDALRDWLTIRGTPLYVANFAAISIAILAAVVVVFSATNRIVEVIIASPSVNPRGLNAQLIRIASKLIGLALSVAVFLIGGQYLGIPIATLLASAGIGGVALALGAQDTLKTLFGTVVLMADKPFRVGERIVFQGYDGVVEDIGLRSTKLRLLTSHQVTIPNDELARTDIENIGRRQSIRRVADIHIPLDTPQEKVEAAVAAVREELKDHEGMDPDFPPRVYFFDFLPNAFTIRVIYW